MNPVSFQPALSYRPRAVRFGDTRPERPIYEDTHGAKRLIGLVAFSAAVSVPVYMHLFSAIKKLIVGE